MSINRVVISGNLTRDAETRFTASGMPITSFGVAVYDRRKNPQSGEWESVPNFIDCTWFGSRGEKVAPYMKHKTPVLIEGKLRWSQWERDGQKRNKVEVIVDDMEFMSRRNGADDDQGAMAQGSAPQGGFSQSNYQAASPAPAIDASSSVYDDDIPF